MALCKRRTPPFRHSNLPLPPPAPKSARLNAINKYRVVPSKLIIYCPPIPFCPSLLHFSAPLPGGEWSSAFEFGGPGLCFLEGPSSEFGAPWSGDTHKHICSYVEYLARSLISLLLKQHALSSCRPSHWNTGLRTRKSSSQSDRPSCGCEVRGVFFRLQFNPEKSEKTMSTEL